MPPTTRSKTQTNLEDQGVSVDKTSSKRKASNTRKSSPTKKLKPTKKTSTPSQEGDDAKQHLMQNAVKQKEDADSSESVTINRAPVLELWSACVASFTYPKLSWSTCLSIGSAISTVTAISKGRSIGVIDKPNPSEQAAKQAKRAEAQQDLDEVTVMQFNLRLEDGCAVVGDKPKKANEDLLEKKYGDKYGSVKQSMQAALQSWKDKEDELNDRAFRMYEDFRPSVSSGQKGWGRKGELNMATIRTVVTNE